MGTRFCALGCAVAVLAAMTAACSEPKPDVARCADIADNVAGVIVARALAFGEDFSARPSKSGTDELVPQPTPHPTDAGTDAFAIARAMTRRSPADAAAGEWVDDLQASAEAADCGTQGWADDQVAQELTDDLAQRTRALDGKPSTSEYVGLNMVATVAALLDGSIGSESPRSARPTQD